MGSGVNVARGEIGGGFDVAGDVVGCSKDAGVVVAGNVSAGVSCMLVRKL